MIQSVRVGLLVDMEKRERKSFRFLLIYAKCLKEKSLNKPGQFHLLARAENQGFFKSGQKYFWHLNNLSFSQKESCSFGDILGD